MRQPRSCLQRRVAAARGGVAHRALKWRCVCRTAVGYQQVFVDSAAAMRETALQVRDWRRFSGRFRTRGAPSSGHPSCPVRAARALWVTHRRLSSLRAAADKSLPRGALPQRHHGAATPPAAPRS